MHIVFAAPECVPFVKTGGLADVIGALPREIAAQGHQVTVYLPFYRQVQMHVKERKIAIRSITIPFEYYNRFVTILDGGKSEGVQYYLVDCPELFDREFPYGTEAGEYQDNWERFGLYGRAVLEAAKQLGVPDIFHVHNWQGAMIPVYLRTTYYFDPALKAAGTVLTIHNGSLQGWFPPVTTERLLLPWEVFTMEKLESYNTFNFLKGGIVYSDAITTVSPRFAEEIRTAEFGNGMDAVLRSRAADLHGILNGADYSKWNPETDGNIAAHYTPSNLAGKAICRRDLLHAFGAQHVGDSTAILGVVSRLATQKGFDLLEQAMEALAQEDIFLVVLGTGEPYYESLFRTLQERYPLKVAARIAYDDVLAHKIEAGSDIFLMPSRYEPSGLSQMYAMKYGTVPVVHAIGGLDDTVEEWNGETKTGTGFKFYPPDSGRFLEAIRRSLGVFRDKAAWTQLIHNCMAQDFSWKAPAAAYIKIYEEVARRRS
jgi:starch synthase